MRILMLSPFSPYPPNSGGRIRQWELISYLGRRHDLTVVYNAFTEEEYLMRKSIETCCSAAIAVRHPQGDLSEELPGLRNLPWPVRALRTGEMIKTLEGLKASSFDAAIVEFIFMSHYCDMLPARRILHEHNIESGLFRQYSELPNVESEKIFGIKKGRAFWKATWMIMEQFENRMWPLFPLRVTVSEKDRQEMERRCPRGRTLVIENGVNIGTVDPVPVVNSRRILFMGTMDYYPNTDAAVFLAKSVMPFLWSRDPGISLCIAGQRPPDSVIALASDPRIEVIADPESMRDVASGCCLSVVPLRLGGGTRIKILDSFAMGLPVVSTRLGCEGLSVRDGHDILIRDDPGEFADAAWKILSDPELALDLRRNGRRSAEERYDWRSKFGQLETEIISLVKG